MDTDKEKAVRKQIRTNFIISLTVGMILLGMGIFAIIVCTSYSSFASKIGLLMKFEQTGFPPFDIFGYLIQFLFDVFILGMYGIFPAAYGTIIILRNNIMRLFKNKYADESAYYRWSARMSVIDLCIVIVNVVATIGYMEFGIYPFIYTTVNILLAVVMTINKIKSSKLKKKNDEEYLMKISALFKSIVDSDIAPIVICETDHKIVYMNPAAIERYAKKGGADLIGKSLLDCHNDESNKKIKSIVAWFDESPENNRIFTFHNPKENKDVYMIALRDDHNVLIGYYEKHEYRTPESDLTEA
ncbi:MAG: PAS domain-containing protein [Ruminococcus flavefaciens]|nr:PAS domain-containing protein [Ruminococcus flavefaciens]MCM1059323.1 PAS domain-containing protein [Eubacterium sp.]